MTQRLAIACLALAMAGCGGTENGQSAQTDAGTGSATETAATPAPEGGDRITADYLAGRWCYEGFDVDETRMVEHNVAYVFEPDGVLRYQRRNTGPIDQTGSYEIDEDELAIDPINYTRFELEVESMRPDEMVLRSVSTLFYFSRGACPE